MVARRQKYRRLCQPVLLNTLDEKFTAVNFGWTFSKITRFLILGLRFDCYEIIAATANLNRKSGNIVDFFIIP